MAITTDDFNKIWASTSPLTPYEFSESSYKEGWNFVGATPPSRQMWDFLQKNNDEKSQYLLNNFDNYVKQGGMNLWNALHSRDSATLKGLTNNQWNALGLFLRYFTTTGNFENQPTQYGQLLNIPADKKNESTQLWIEQSSGKIYVRGGNGDSAVKDEVFKPMAFFNSDGHLTFPNGAEMWVY